MIFTVPRTLNIIIMKEKMKILIVFLVLMTSCVFYPGKTFAQESNISFQVFYDQLSPYGQWIDYSEYGYVWIPDAESDFVPYSTDGHWILTDYGWTWASDFEWGWATFHYGRWSYNDSFGWFWVPDNEWGPAWVNWRQADGYYGWSPMEPGITLSMSFGRTYDNHNDNWMFVRDRDIEQSNIQHYYVNHSEQDRIGRNSIIIRNTFQDKQRHATYVSGPTRIQVQKVVGRTITPVVIRGASKPGQEISKGQYRIYRPQVVKNTTNGRQSVPVRVSNMNEVKRTPSRNSTNQNQIGNPVNRTTTQPVRTVTPQNTNTQPIRRQDVNQQDNKQIPQNRISTPSNSNSNYNPAQTPGLKPVDINKPIRRPDVVTPQNNNTQPYQQRVVTPQNKNQQPVQRQVTPQNKNQQPVQQRPVTPQNNNQQPVQQRQVTPQNTNQQPVQQRSVTPQNNIQQPVQKRNESPQNKIQQQVQPERPAQKDNNPRRRTDNAATTESKRQPVQSQNVKESTDKPVKQQKSIKQQVKKEQEKIPDAVTIQK